MVTNRLTSQKSLILLHAKYTSSRNAITYSLPDCVLKYVHGIATSNLNRSPVNAMYLLYHGDVSDNINNVDELHFVQDEFNLYSKTPILPSIGCVHFSISSTLDYKQFLFALTNL